MALGVGDTLSVLVWREGTGDQHPRGHPVQRNVDTEGKRIDIINGEVDTVVQVRIESISPERIVGRVTDNFEPDSPEWEEAREVLEHRYEFDTEVINQANQPRLTIRAKSDYANQWKRHKQSVLSRLPDRT
jgi:hypothetical protein